MQAICLDAPPKTTFLHKVRIVGGKNACHCEVHNSVVKFIIMNSIDPISASMLLTCFAERI